MSAFVPTLRRWIRPYSPRPKIHQWIFRRPACGKLTCSMVSFTFDDFPRSAMLNGAPLLRHFGGHGTFYASLGLMDTEDDRGALFTREDLKTLIDDGHEIGCHTFSHVGARRTEPAQFEAEIVNNRRRMEEILPGHKMQNFSYPGGELTLGLKRRIRKYAASSRGTYNGVNRDRVDLDLLLAQNLYESVSLDYVRKIAEECLAEPGWIIFYGHDVSEHPSVYGCTPGYLEAVLAIVAEKFPIMTVAEVLHSIEA